jgi:hypothetical protein
LIEAQPSALRYQKESSVSFLRELPDLEFLQLQYLPDDVDAINGLRHLRGLVLGEGWTGELRLDGLPNLEWFAVGEVRRETSLGGVLSGVHPGVRHLKVVKSPYRDVAPLAEAFPNLRHLSLGRSTKLETLDGLGHFGYLTSFDLFYCSKLLSLEGVEQATTLIAVELTTLSKVTDLSALAALPALRFLRVDLKVVDSLAPLAGHPSLEVVKVFSRVLDGDPGPLSAMPALKAFDGSLRDRVGPDGPPGLAAVPGIEPIAVRAWRG